MKYKKSELALKAANNILEHGSGHFLSGRAISAFNEFRKAAGYKPEQMATFDALLAGFDKNKVSANDASSNMAHALELLKQSK